MVLVNPIPISSARTMSMAEWNGSRSLPSFITTARDLVMASRCTESLWFPRVSRPFPAGLARGHLLPGLSNPWKRPKAGRATPNPVCCLAVSGARCRENSRSEFSGRPRSGRVSHRPSVDAGTRRGEAIAPKARPRPHWRTGIVRCAKKVDHKGRGCGVALSLCPADRAGR